MVPGGQVPALWGETLTNYERHFCEEFLRNYFKFYRVVVTGGFTNDDVVRVVVTVSHDDNEVVFLQDFADRFPSEQLVACLRLLAP